MVYNKDDAGGGAVRHEIIVAYLIKSAGRLIQIQRKKNFNLSRESQILGNAYLGNAYYVKVNL